MIGCQVLRSSLHSSAKVTGTCFGRVASSSIAATGRVSARVSISTETFSSTAAAASLVVTCTAVSPALTATSTGTAGASVPAAIGIAGRSLSLSAADWPDRSNPSASDRVRPLASKIRTSPRSVRFSSAIAAAGSETRPSSFSPLGATARTRPNSSAFFGSGASSGEQAASPAASRDRQVKRTRRAIIKSSPHRPSLAANLVPYAGANLVPYAGAGARNSRSAASIHPPR